MQATTRHNSWNTYQKCFKPKLKKARQPNLQSTARKTPQTPHANHQTTIRKWEKEGKKTYQGRMEEKWEELQGG